MKAITEPPHYAALIAVGVKTIVTRPRPIDYRGRIAIHAAKTEPPLRMGERVGDWRYYPADGASAPERVRQPARLLNRTGLADKRIALPLGAVVASATLTDCVPVVQAETEVAEGRQIAVSVDRRYLWRRNGRLSLNIDDQLPYGDFSPGRRALLLDDIAPTTTRCPWCWGDQRDPAMGYDPESFRFTDVPCPVCDAEGFCDPVSATGHPGLWEWSPT